MSATLRRTLVLVSVLTSACHTWHAVPISPADSGSPRPHVRVVRMGGQAVELDDVRFSPDRVVGVGNGTRVAIPRDSVAFVEEHRFSSRRSLGLLIGVPVAALAAGFLVLGLAFALGG